MYPARTLHCRHGNFASIFADAGAYMEANCQPSPSTFLDNRVGTGTCVVRGSCVCSSNFQGDACSPDGNPMTGRRLTHDEGSGEISNEETTYQNNA